MTSEQNIQLHDREQFRRYAEAALGAMNPRDFSGYDRMASGAFQMAINMMLAESEAFEQYQLKATRMMIDEERKRQGIKPPYTDFS